MFELLKHNFILDRNNWYKCTKCNIKYYCGEFISGFELTIESSCGLPYDELTCDEIIIKRILE